MFKHLAARVTPGSVANESPTICGEFTEEVQIVFTAPPIFQPPIK